MRRDEDGLAFQRAHGVERLVVLVLEIHNVGAGGASKLVRGRLRAAPNVHLGGLTRSDEDEGGVRAGAEEGAVSGLLYACEVQEVGLWRDRALPSTPLRVCAVPPGTYTSLPSGAARGRRRDGARDRDGDRGEMQGQPRRGRDGLQRRPPLARRRPWRPPAETKRRDDERRRPHRGDTDARGVASIARRMVVSGARESTRGDGASR